MSVVSAFALLLAACGSDSTEPEGEPDQPEPAAPTESDGEPQADEGAALDFYVGKTITLDMAVNPGGAVDATARLWAKHLPRFLEGEPTFVVTNSPGGGQMTSPNTYHNITERDGTNLWIGSPTTHQAWRFENPGMDYDLGDWEPLIAQPGGSIIYIDPDTSGINSVDDLLEGNHDPLFFAGQVPSGSDLFKVWPLEMLEIDYEATWGYEGRGPARVAFEQGEVNLGTDAISVWPEIEDRFPDDWMIMFSFGQLEEGELVRDPSWPDAPHFGEVYEQKFGEAPSGEMWDAYLMQMSIDQGMGRTLWIHGDAPPEAIEALKDGVSKMVQDEEFLAESAELLGDYPPVVGTSLDAVVSNLVDVDPSVVDFIVDYTFERFGHDIRG